MFLCLLFRKTFASLRILKGNPYFSISSTQEHCLRPLYRFDAVGSELIVDAHLMDEDDKLKGEDNSFLSASLLDDAYFMLEVFFIRRTKLNFYKNLKKVESCYNEFSSGLLYCTTWSK